MSDYKPVEPGETYNGVKIIAFSHVDNYRNRRYICTCHCGTDFIAIGRSLKAGRTRSCGCLANKKTVRNPGKHKNRLQRSPGCVDPAAVYLVRRAE